MLICKSTMITQLLKYCSEPLKMDYILNFYSDEYIQKRIKNNTIKSEINAINGTLCELAFEYSLNNEYDEDDILVNVFDDIKEGSFKKSLISNLPYNHKDYRYLDYIWLDKNNPKTIEIKSTMLYEVESYMGNTFINLFFSCLRAMRNNKHNDYVVLFTNNKPYSKSNNIDFYSSTYNDVEIQFFGIVDLKKGVCDFLNSQHKLNKKAKFYINNFEKDMITVLKENNISNDILVKYRYNNKIGEIGDE